VTIVMIVLAVLGAWLLVSVLLALAIGRATRIANDDHRRRMAQRTAGSRPRPTSSAGRPRVSAAS
jgi:hypothetical protein